MIFNCGVSYDLQNPIIPKRKKSADTTHIKLTGNNLISGSFSLNPFNFNANDFVLRINYLQKLHGKKIYLGGGITMHTWFPNNYFAHNFSYLASEYRPLKFISLGYYPGLHACKIGSE
ncbi:MAG: hypothetical protein JNJ99_10880 [Crocinitomicaceae bacterium]|nr:hypothetical protein [Crocinitomicaceae bacterium]